MRVPFLLGRLLFGGYFISAGINHLRQTYQLAQYAASKNVPKPDLAVKATGVVLIAGGTSILLGLSRSLGQRRLLAFSQVSRPSCMISGKQSSQTSA
jgi:putative oxidoreductase